MVQKYNAKGVIIMDKKVCIITGANSGIGKQAAIQIANKGFHVVIACRSLERGKKALDEIKKKSNDNSVELMIVDMSLKSSVHLFAQEVINKFSKIDILIHNAAIFNLTQKEARFTSEGVETFWATNHIGPVLLTNLLLDSIKKSDNGRILTVSSKGLVSKPNLKVDLNDPEFKYKKFNVANAYYQAKIAQVMYTYWLAEMLKNTSVTVNCIRVTAVRIDIKRHSDLSSITRFIYRIKSRLSKTPEEMAKTYAFLATSNEVAGVTGKYFNENNKEVKSNNYSRDSLNIDAVMQLTQKYL